MSALSSRPTDPHKRRSSDSTATKLLIVLLGGVVSITVIYSWVEARGETGGRSAAVLEKHTGEIKDLRAMHDFQESDIRRLSADLSQMSREQARQGAVLESIQRDIGWLVRRSGGIPTRADEP